MWWCICGDHERKSHKWVTNERVMFRVSNEARFICRDLYLNVVVYMWRPRTKESQLKESRTLNLSEARFICRDSCLYVVIYMWRWGTNAKSYGIPLCTYAEMHVHMWLFICGDESRIKNRTGSHYIHNGIPCDTFHSQCCIPKIHKIEQLRFLGILRYKFKLRFCFCLNL